MKKEKLKITKSKKLRKEWEINPRYRIHEDTKKKKLSKQRIKEIKESLGYFDE